MANTEENIKVIESTVGIGIPKDGQNYSQTKQNTLSNLNEAKKYWNTAHEIGAKLLDKSTAGKVYLLVQGTTGSIIVDTANGVPLDEQLVGIVGDIVGGAILTSMGLGVVNIGMTLSGESIGTKLQNFYTNVKKDINGQYWKYETNQSFMVGGQMVTYDYVKIKCYANGDAIIDNATQSPVVEKISESVYKQNTKFELKDINFDDGAKIEFNEKNQIVSIEIDNQKAIYNNDGTVTFPSDITEAHPELVVNIVNGVASLKSGQTISHVALNTKYTTKELLQYNGLTEEQAKNLPVGFVVKIPKDVDNVQGGYGNVKVYEGQDGSLTYHIPSDDKGNIKVVKISSDGEILRNDFDNNEVILDKGVSTILQEKLEELIADKNSVVFLKNKDNENTTDTEEKYSIVDVRHPDNVQRAKDEYHAKVSVNNIDYKNNKIFKKVG